MIETIKKIEDVRKYIGNTAANAAITRLFKNNLEKIKEASAEIAEANSVLANASTQAVKCAMEQVLEVSVHRKEMLKQERKEAKEHLASEKDEWEISPIDIGEILEEIFRS